jgi:hypothetical protein
MSDSRDDARAQPADFDAINAARAAWHRVRSEDPRGDMLAAACRAYAAVLSAPGRETTPTKKWGEVETVAPQYSVSPTPTPTEPEPSEEEPLTVAEAVRLRYGSRGLPPDQVREIARATLSYASCESPVYCGTRDDADEIIGLVVSRFTEEGNQG